MRLYFFKKGDLSSKEPIRASKYSKKREAGLLKGREQNKLMTMDIQLNKKKQRVQEDQKQVQEVLMHSKEVRT